MRGSSVDAAAAAGRLSGVLSDASIQGAVCV